MIRSNQSEGLELPNKKLMIDDSEDQMSLLAK